MPKGAKNQGTAFSQKIPLARDSTPERPRSWWDKEVLAVASAPISRAPEASSAGLSCPVTVPATIISPFGLRDPRLKNASKDHTGVDFRNRMDRPVFAVQDGKIAQIWSGGRGGSSIRVLNQDGSVSGYAHSKAVVKAGDEVRSGQRIGYSDGSGNVEGPHLHYTFSPSRGAPKVDPMKLLRAICKVG